MFKDALIKSASQLFKLKKGGGLSDFALIGGMAIAAYLEPRATADIDYLIKLGDMKLKDIGAALKGRSCSGDIYDPLAGSISYSIISTKGKVPIQLIQLHPGIEDIAVSNIDTLEMNGNPLPVVNRRGLIILKLYAGGPVDIEDAHKLLASKELKPKDLEYLRSKAQALRLTNRLNKALR